MNRLAFRAMDRKSRKNFLAMLEKQFGFSRELDYLFFINGKDKVFLISREAGAFPIDALRVNVIGLYAAEIGSGEVRLSIEGSQLIGPYASKNIIEVPEEIAARWLRGEDIKVQGTGQGIQDSKDVLNSQGCQDRKGSQGGQGSQESKDGPDSQRIQDSQDGQNCSGFVIVKSGDDYLGSGKLKEGSILNFVPKNRRIHSVS